jgi:hypothetical protein
MPCKTRFLYSFRYFALIISLIPGWFRVGSMSAPCGSWVGSGVDAGSAPGGFRIGSVSAPGGFRIGSGATPGGWVNKCIVILYFSCDIDVSLTDKKV